ncbi:hypothetical protein Tco_0161762 [Tanacetum coccineum]
MSTLTFAETHNMIAFLKKLAESDGFHEIIDFLNVNQIHYALTVNPTIYTSCIEQFWETVKANTVNGECQLQALVDKKRVIIMESSIRSDLHLEDAGGIDCLLTATIFEELARMGYKKPSQRLTFYKAFFSPQWKFLIQTITQCHSAKSTGRLDDVEMFDTDDLHGDVVIVDMAVNSDAPTISVTTADEGVTAAKIDEFTPTSSPTTVIDELTLAQTLIEIKAAKPKAVTTAATITTTRPKARGTKDKGKAIMIEPEVPLKRKDQVALNEEMARNLEAQLQAKLIEEEKMARKREEAT